MKKELILVCAALALAGCNREANTGNEGGANSGYNSSTGTGNSLNTNSTGATTGRSANTNDNTGPSTQSPK